MHELYGTEQMGETAENTAEMIPDLTRELQDAFSVQSHRRAIAAIDTGKFNEEIAPVAIPQKKGEPLLATYERI